MKPWMKSALRVLLALAIVAGIVWYFGNALYVNRPKPVTGNIDLELQRISLPSVAMRVSPKETLITSPAVMPAKAGIQYLPEKVLDSGLRRNDEQIEGEPKKKGGVAVVNVGG